MMGLLNRTSKDILVDKNAEKRREKEAKKRQEKTGRQDNRTSGKDRKTGSLTQDPLCP